MLKFKKKNELILCKLLYMIDWIKYIVKENDLWKEIDFEEFKVCR